MESETTKDLSSTPLHFSLSGGLRRSTQLGGQMSGVGVTEVKLEYPVESSHKQYMEYGETVFTTTKKLSVCS
jgi:hypothetical protein